MGYMSRQITFDRASIWPCGPSKVLTTAGCTQARSCRQSHRRGRSRGRSCRELQRCAICWLASGCRAVLKLRHGVDLTYLATPCGNSSECHHFQNACRLGDGEQWLCLTSCCWYASQQEDKAEQRQKKRRANAEQRRFNNLVVDKPDAMQVPSKVKRNLL